MRTLSYQARILKFTFCSPVKFGSQSFQWRKSWARAYDAHVRRRSFLGAVFAATALGAQGCAAAGSAAPTLNASAATATPRPQTATHSPTPEPTLTPTPEPAPPQFVPQHTLPPGPIWGLPDEVGNQIAWTVDDGASPEVVMAYAQFAEQTGTRLTFFINGMYDAAWSPAAPVLAPMIVSGQVQIANHTLTHPSLLTLSDAQIQDELMQNHHYIEQLFGVDARPYYRPPYGDRNERTDAAAAAVGYSTPVMWYGSLGDSGHIPPEVMLQEADKWLHAARIILGHANAPTVTTLFPQLLNLLASRGLQTVTLNDVFIR